MDESILPHFVVQTIDEEYVARCVFKVPNFKIKELEKFMKENREILLDDGSAATILKYADNLEEAQEHIKELVEQKRKSESVSCSDQTVKDILRRLKALEKDYKNLKKENDNLKMKLEAFESIFDSCQDFEEKFIPELNVSMSRLYLQKALLLDSEIDSLNFVIAELPVFKDYARSPWEPMPPEIKEKFNILFSFIVSERYFIRTGYVMPEGEKATAAHTLKVKYQKKKRNDMRPSAKKPKLETNDEDCKNNYS